MDSEGWKRAQVLVLAFRPRQLHQLPGEASFIRIGGHHNGCAVGDRLGDSAHSRIPCRGRLLQTEDCLVDLRPLPSSSVRSGVELLHLFESFGGDK